jgi:nucleoside-diphosphate-sugar epimerase
MPSNTSKPDISRLSGSRALVTGGAGLIGSHLADHLAMAGVGEIVVLDNFSRGRRDSLDFAATRGRVTIVEGDIRDGALLARLCQGIDLLFHLAGIRLIQSAQEPRLCLEVMAEGTFNVIEAALAARVKRVVAASSSSIYGLADNFPIREDHHPYNNTTIYGAAKVFNEGLLAAFRDMHGLDYVALRPFNVYGPRMDTHGAYTEVLVRWMDRVGRGQPPLIFGDGKETMDYIYVGDVARAFVLAAASDAAGEVFNIASGVETSLNELAQALILAMGARVTPEHGPVRKLNAVSRRLADVGRARERLGFSAEVKLQEGLVRLVDWWRATQTGTMA